MYSQVISKFTQRSLAAFAAATLLGSGIASAAVPDPGLGSPERLADASLVGGHASVQGDGFLGGHPSVHGDGFLGGHPSVHGDGFLGGHPSASLDSPLAR